MQKFRELLEPDYLSGKAGVVKFWFIAAADDHHDYLHKDLVVRNGCHNKITNTMGGHYKTKQEAENYRYMQYGIGTVVSIVGSEPTKVDNGSRVLDLDI